MRSWGEPTFSFKSSEASMLPLVSGNGDEWDAMLTFSWIEEYISKTVSRRNLSTPWHMMNETEMGQSLCFPTGIVTWKYGNIIILINQSYSKSKTNMNAETWEYSITWQHPDMLAMLDNANVLSLNSDVCPVFLFSFNGGSATVGITNIPSSWEGKSRGT